MDIHNLAMVRATNHIPVDGVILPTSEERVLSECSHIDAYTSQIKELLRKKKKLEIRITKMKNLIIILMSK